MRTPIHLWFIGVLSLLWNAGGAYDYVAAKLKIGPYAGDLPPDIASFFASLPAWYTAAWAIGVWFSVMGSILLLMRSRMAEASLPIEVFVTSADNSAARVPLLCSLPELQ